MSEVREYIPGRFVSSLPRHECPPDALTGDSTNWMIDGAKRKARRRRGQSVPTGWDTVCASSWSGNKPRGRQVLGIRAAQLTDRSNHPTVLYTDDESNPKRGEVVTYDSDASNWYSLGQEYGSAHYPATGYGGTGVAGTGINLNFRWSPLWTDASADEIYQRGTSAANRLKMFGNGRALMESGEWLYGLGHTPWMWNKVWNYDSAGDTEEATAEVDSYVTEAVSGYSAWEALPGTTMNDANVTSNLAAADGDTSCIFSENFGAGGTTSFTLGLNETIAPSGTSWTVNYSARTTSGINTGTVTFTLYDNDGVGHVSAAIDLATVWTSSYQALTATCNSVSGSGTANTVKAAFSVGDGSGGQLRFSQMSVTGLVAIAQASDNVNRLRPWGHQVPLYHPTITASGGTSSVKSWRENTVFYYTTAFQFEDGSIGPFTPISDSVADAMANGTRGRVILDTTNDYYAYMRWTNIPRGPKGTIGRVLARTKVLDSTNFQTTYPGPNDLRIIAIIRNNTETSYDDYQGDDTTLVATPDLVRIDHKWPRRGKYMVANDSRFLMCGELKPGPAAIILAPTGITASRDVNAYGNASGNYIDDCDSQRADEYLASPGTRGFYAWITSTSLRTLYDSGSVANISAHAIVTGGVYITLQALVDAVNQTTVSSSGKEWAAVLAPGVDGSTLTSKLQTTASAAAVGDGSRGTDPTADRIWSHGPGHPITLYFRPDYMDDYPADEQAVEFTRGGPSFPMSIMNWSASKECERKPGNAAVGRCLGAAPLGHTFIVFYEQGIYKLISSKEGNADEDMRLVPIVTGNIYVVSDSSIFWGDGFAGCMTAQGVWVTDGEHYEIISGDLWNSEDNDPADNTRGRGELKNEINRSLKATQAGGRTTADDESFLYLQAMSDQLHLTYRKSATAANDRRVVLDFSSNATRSGLSCFKGPDGRMLGWGTPCTNTFGAMAEIADQSGGMVRYGVIEDVAQGKVCKFDTGTTDDGSVITATGYFATDFLDTLKLKVAEKLAVLYRKNGTGLSLVMARDQGTSASVHGTDTYTTTLATTGDDLYSRVIVDPTPEARTPAEVVELRIADDGAGDPPEVWRVALTYSVLDGFPR